MTKHEMDAKYGEPKAIPRITHIKNDKQLFNQAEDIIEKRCVVCHACYDAPCQLKLTSIEGLDRGANKTPIYNAYRLLATAPSHAFEDGEGHDDWRKQEFYPVLNEREQTPKANLDLSVMYQMLLLKQKHPTPNEALLPDSFDLKLQRNQYCPKIEEFGDFAQEHPLWGMPYGLPALNQHEFSVLKNWLEQGAIASPHPELSPGLQKNVADWERFFNGSSLKEQLVSRYLFEHLYLASLYFSELDKTQFFRLVRSYTPPGQPIKVMPSRRPFDAPLNPVFYYRLKPMYSTVVAKTHMPYALSVLRMKEWQQLFFSADYQVTYLPDYDVETSSNPFYVFEQIPVRSRYKFLLEEAQFSIMNFIKGPVCRGQVALSVINDYFWVVFSHPESPGLEISEQFLRENKSLVQFPAYWESNSVPWTWLSIANKQKEYIEASAAYKNKYLGKELPVDLNIIWDGEGSNANAALTIFRHFDSATVVKGFVGDKPQTAWLITYPLLERIHYLLVAGFDVNGNVLHQLFTRLDMDFLRMEGEANFLTLLPKQERSVIQKEWYLGAENEVQEFFDVVLKNLTAESSIPYHTDNHLQELLKMLAERTHAGRYLLDSNQFKGVNIAPLVSLNGTSGINVSYLAQTSIVEVVADGRSYWFTLLHNNTYQNKTRLLTENNNRTPEKDSLLITPGIISSYPNAFFKVEAASVDDFVARIRSLSSEADYHQLKSHYGVRRTDPHFWGFSDRLHAYFKSTAGVEFGLLDYNRLENR